MRGVMDMPFIQTNIEKEIELKIKGIDTKEICKDKVDTIKRCVYVGYIWLRGDRMDSI